MKILKNHRHLLEQLIKYGAVGVVNTLLTLAVIFVLTKIFSVDYIAANAAGYVLGFINSFILNKLWTFRSKGSLGKESLLFAAVFAVTYTIQLGFLIVLKETLHINEDIAQLVSMVFYTCIGFAGNKLITFRKKG
jgi:putative flippase GtrA